MILEIFPTLVHFLQLVPNYNQSL